MYPDGSLIPPERTFGVPVVPPVPVRMSVLLPRPLKVIGVAMVRTLPPVPEASRTAPPVVPARSITRSVDSLEEPVHCSVPVLMPFPMAMVPSATVVGAPRPPGIGEPEPLFTLPMVETLNVPFLMNVCPV